MLIIMLRLNDEVNFKILYSSCFTRRPCIL